MKFLITFLAGAIAGAAAALMLAPKSGSELRAQMAEEAAKDRERARRGYETASQRTQESYEKVQQKMHLHGDEQVDVEVDEVLTDE